MFKLLLFLKRIHFVLLFLVLESVAITLFLHGNVYQKAKIAGSSNRLVSGIYDKVADVTGYFGLRAENDMLIAEVARLRSELSAFKTYDTLGMPRDSIPGLQYYQYQPARVIRNGVTKRQNYLTIDRGKLDGVERVWIDWGPE